MYIHSVTIRNFRIFKEETIRFQPHFNLIIGPNDSGKSAIVDALRLALTTRTQERLTIDDMFDFHSPGKEIGVDIELRFADASEASGFPEWLTLTDLPAPDNYVLNLYCRTAKSPRGDYYYMRRKAGPTLDRATELDAAALERLQAVYLKPIRDARLDLSGSSSSRLSRILYAHNAIRQHAPHIIADFNRGMADLNARFDSDGSLHADTTGTINEYFSKFSVAPLPPTAKMGLFDDTMSEDAQLRAILQKFHLKTNDHPGVLGLGTTNTLYMASELMLIEDSPPGNLKVALVEELEAHIHPMRELKIVKELQADCREKSLQVIATSHSPNLASQLKIENLLLCQDGSVFDFREGSTQLQPDDFKYLERFLDVTKSNMFFARGIIFVEGPTEQFLVPAFARSLGYDLTDRGVAVVVVNHLSFRRYARAFRRMDGKANRIPVAIVTDADAKSAADIASAVAADDAPVSLVRWFYGKPADGARGEGTGPETSTFERIILAGQGALRAVYETSYKAAKGGILKADAAEAYGQIEDVKAPVAQEASIMLDLILASQDGEDVGGSVVTSELLRADIVALFPNIRDAIVHACSAADGEPSADSPPKQTKMDL